MSCEKLSPRGTVVDASLATSYVFHSRKVVMDNMPYASLPLAIWGKVFEYVGSELIVNDNVGSHDTCNAELLALRATSLLFQVLMSRGLRKIQIEVSQRTINCKALVSLVASLLNEPIELKALSLGFFNDCSYAPTVCGDRLAFLIARCRALQHLSLRLPNWSMEGASFMLIGQNCSLQVLHIGMQILSDPTSSINIFSPFCDMHELHFHRPTRIDHINPPLFSEWRNLSCVSNCFDVSAWRDALLAAPSLQTIDVINETIVTNTDMIIWCVRARAMPIVKSLKSMTYCAGLAVDKVNFNDDGLAMLLSTFVNLEKLALICGDYTLSRPVMDIVSNTLLQELRCIALQLDRHWTEFGPPNLPVTLRHLSLNCCRIYSSQNESNEDFCIRLQNCIRGHVRDLEFLSMENVDIV